MSSASGLRPAVFVKLETIKPKTHGHNILVKVLEKTLVVDRINNKNERLRVEECLVADETGSMLVSVRNEQCEKLQKGSMVALRNCKVVMHHCNMRLAIDKWGQIKPSTDLLPGEPDLSKNFSSIEYETLGG